MCGKGGEGFWSASTPLAKRPVSVQCLSMTHHVVKQLKQLHEVKYRVTATVSVYAWIMRVHDSTLV